MLKPLMLNVRDATLNPVIGDGMNNDAPGIQEVINMATTCGVDNTATIFFPPGTYKLDAKITLPDNVILLGSGSSSILLGSILITDFVVEAIGRSKISIQNLTFQGDGTHTLLRFEDSRDVIIEQSTFAQFANPTSGKSCIEVVSTSTPSFEVSNYSIRSNFIYPSMHGVLIESESEDHDITNVKVDGNIIELRVEQAATNSGPQGLIKLGTGTKGFTVNSNVLCGNYKVANLPQLTNYALDGILIANSKLNGLCTSNAIYGFVRGGITVAGSETFPPTTVAENLILNSNNISEIEILVILPGVYQGGGIIIYSPLQELHNISIENNIVNDSDFTGIVQIGYMLKNVSILANVVTNIGLYGIVAEAQQTVVSYNRIANVGYYGIGFSLANYEDIFVESLKIVGNSMNNIKGFPVPPAKAAGIAIMSDSDPAKISTIQDVSISGNIVRDTEVGILPFDIEINNLQIQNNQILDVISEGMILDIDQTLIQSNRVTSEDANLTTLIHLQSANECVVSENYLELNMSVPSMPSIINTGTDNTIRANRGYKTEGDFNAKVAVGTTGSLGMNDIVIPHDLDQVPKTSDCLVAIYDVQGASDWEYDQLEVLDATSTNITVRINIIRLDITPYIAGLNVKVQENLNSPNI